MIVSHPYVETKAIFFSSKELHCRHKEQTASPPAPTRPDRLGNPDPHANRCHLKKTPEHKNQYECTGVSEQGSLKTQ